MSAEFVSLNEVFLPVTGGDIEGSLDVNGLLTVNDKSGNGTVYDVADEIAELKSACDSVSPLTIDSSLSNVTFKVNANGNWEIRLVSGTQEYVLVLNSTHIGLWDATNNKYAWNKNMTA